MKINARKSQNIGADGNKLSLGKNGGHKPSGLGELLWSRKQK